MRPAGPLPATALMSTPISRARRRTAGEAAAGISSTRGARARSGGGARRLAGCRGGIDTTLASAFGSGLGSALGSGWLPRAAPWPAAARGGLAGTVPAAPPSSTVKITAPTCTLSPFLTLISLTTPATDDGTSIVALSVSSSMTGCSFLTVSPTLTSTLATSPEATFSPSSGTLNSVTYDTAGLDFSGSIPRSLIAFCTTPRSMTPSRARSPSVPPR
jgi:hypothetical protein